MLEDKLMMQRRKMAAARKIQRVKQQQQNPAKYEKAKLKNRLTKEKYDEKQRNMKQLVTKEEVLADRKMKAMARKKQRHKKKLKILGLENVKRTLEVAVTQFGLPT